MSKRGAEPPKRISVLRLQRKAACRQYRAARWFLLPEVELAAAASRRQQIPNLLQQVPMNYKSGTAKQWQLIGVSLLQKCLIINPLQKHNAHKSLQFYRCRSNRFGENGLTGHCGAVFSKQAAPKSHAFFGCYEPLPPDGHIIHEQALLPARDAYGRRRQKAAELQIRLTEHA